MEKFINEMLEQEARTTIAILSPSFKKFTSELVSKNKQLEAELEAEKAKNEELKEQLECAQHNHKAIKDTLDLSYSQSKHIISQIKEENQELKGKVEFYKQETEKQKKYMLEAYAGRDKLKLHLSKCYLHLKIEKYEQALKEITKLPRSIYCMDKQSYLACEVADKCLETYKKCPWYIAKEALK